MNIKPIKDAFHGEKLLKVVPEPMPFVEDAERLARLNYLPGRNLTHVALAREQANRVRRLVFRGQAVTSGIVTGLEVGWSMGPDNRPLLRIQPGRGIARSGEDVIVGRPVSLPLDDIATLTPGKPKAFEFRQQLKSPQTEPFAAALVLKPMAITVRERPSATIPAADPPPPGFVDRVPEDESYDRLWSIDGAQPVLCILEDPPSLNSVPRAHWQNAWAWHVFNKERHGESLPWLDMGLPIAMVGFDPSGNILFVDRHAVARRGGMPRSRSLAPKTGEPRLWQAQVDQLGAQLASVGPVGSALGHFRHLPSIGLLPLDVVSFKKPADPITEKTTWSVGQSFFPPTYLVDVRVCLLEQLDTVFAASKDLKPFDLTVPDSATILLPVGQRYFDDQMLTVEVPDKAFDEQLTKSKGDVAQWLTRRQDLRAKNLALVKAITGKEPAAEPQDGNETAAASVTGTQEDAFGTTKTNGSISVDAEEQLKKTLLSDLKLFSSVEEKDLQDTGNGSPVIAAYLERQKRIQQEEKDALASKGLKALIDYLVDKADRADALVDRGFLRVNGDVYRLGQLLNNNALGTRFAASPSLATQVARQPVQANPAALNVFGSRLFADMAEPTVSVPQAAQSAVATNSPSRNAAVAAASDYQITGADLANSPKIGLTNFTGGNIDRLSAAYLRYTAPDYTKLQGDISSIKALAGDDATVKEAITRLESAIPSPATIEAIKGIANFAEAYVPNFNQITPKQTRKLGLERLAPPDASRVRGDLYDAKLEIFGKLMQLDISLADLTTEFMEPTTDNSPAPKSLKFHEVLRVRLDAAVPGADADEAAHFSGGVKHADLSIAALRAVETRIKEYRSLIDVCREKLAEIEGHVARLQARIKLVADELSEARQDCVVAQALKAEEEARVKAINDRRQAILEKHVSFVVFHRPRTVASRVSTPTRVLEPALRVAPVPECLNADLPIPADMAPLTEAFRQAPVTWYKQGPKWIEQVNRLDHLRALLQRATEVAANRPRVLTASNGRYSKTLERVFASRALMDSARPSRLRDINPASLATMTWKGMATRAREVLTLGHLIDVGPSGQARLASGEIHDLFKVGACLHRDFCRVAPVLRLAWAEAYSQFDGPADFRDMARLPKWSDVPFTLRREMQMHVDWLFSRMDASMEGAVELMNDLVRVALLLSSHAPVDQLIAGALADTATPSIGGLIPIVVDPARIHIGMRVVIEQTKDSTGKTALVHAVIEDITSTRASARVTAIPAHAQLDPALATVRFMESSRFRGR